MSGMIPTPKRNSAMPDAMPIASVAHSKPPENGAPALAPGHSTCQAKNTARLRMTPTTAAVMPVSGAVIVTLPQLVSLEDAGRGLNMFRTLEVPILGIIENMSYLELPDGTRMDIFGTGGGERLAQATQAIFLGKVPMDQNVRIGGDTGKPIVATDPESPVAVALTDIAQRIAAQVSVAALSMKNELPINIVE